MNYELRIKLHELVNRGLLDRKHYYSLVELLAEAPRLMPQHRDDVARSEQLLHQLVQLVQQPEQPPLLQPPPEPPRQRIGIIGHSHSVAATVRSIQADPHYRPDAMDLVAMPLGEIVHIERDRPLPFIAGSTFFGQEEVQPIEPKVTLSFRQHFIDAGFKPKEFPKPHFNGYMNKRRRKGKW